MNGIYNLQDLKILPWEKVNEPTVTDRNPACSFARIPGAPQDSRCLCFRARVGTSSESSFGH